MLLLTQGSDFQNNRDRACIWESRGTWMISEAIAIDEVTEERGQKWNYIKLQNLKH